MLCEWSYERVDHAVIEKLLILIRLWFSTSSHTFHITGPVQGLLGRYFSVTRPGPILGLVWCHCPFSPIMKLESLIPRFTKVTTRPIYIQTQDYDTMFRQLNCFLHIQLSNVNIALYNSSCHVTRVTIIWLCKSATPALNRLLVLCADVTAPNE